MIQILGVQLYYLVVVESVYMDSTVSVLTVNPVKYSIRPRTVGLLNVPLEPRPHHLSSDFPDDPLYRHPIPKNKFIDFAAT